MKKLMKKLPCEDCILIPVCRNRKFDIIFIGAPYGSPNLEKALEELAEGDLLKSEGVIVAEHRFKHTLSPEFGVLRKVREARYGDTILVFYKKQ